VFVLEKLFQPSLKFAGKRVREASTLGLASGLTHKDLAGLEKVVRDEQCSLLRKLGTERD